MLDLSQLTLISGGQTGVDRAALDFALAHGIRHGGWCPRWRQADDGQVPKRYNLVEYDSEGYSGRTLANVLDADATLLVSRGKLTPGTKLTLKFARELSKPHFMLSLAGKMPWPKLVQEWIKENAIHRLNVAGASEGKRPCIYSETMRLFEWIFSAD